LKMSCASLRSLVQILSSNLMEASKRRPRRHFFAGRTSGRKRWHDLFYPETRRESNRKGERGDCKVRVHTRGNTEQYPSIFPR
jgi:hypothetical protein